MVAITMEKRRLGLISKACVVVPKHLTLQMASEWIRLYPNAKLLVARPEDFTKDNRQKFIARCVTGDYDAVIMSFTQFERIPMSDEYRQQFMERELDDLMAALEEVDSSDRVSVKALERQKAKLEERLEKLIEFKKDNSLCFEKLCFDYLVCDEAHYYKNCFVATKMSNVAGVQTTAAQKSEDMLMKTKYLNDKYGCNNILYATGTPCTNSMVEFYVMQRYLRPDLLEKAGLETFDDWASTFEYTRTYDDVQGVCGYSDTRYDKAARPRFENRQAYCCKCKARRISERIHGAASPKSGADTQRLC